MHAACYVINTSLVVIMEVNESENEYEYFARCSDSHFWADKGRVKTLIELYRKHECLWNIKRSDYKKSTTKKKTAKEEIGKHFGMTGMVDVIGVASSHRPDNVSSLWAIGICFVCNLKFLTVDRPTQPSILSALWPDCKHCIDALL